MMHVALGFVASLASIAPVVDSIVRGVPYPDSAVIVYVLCVALLFSATGFDWLMGKRK